MRILIISLAVLMCFSLSAVAQPRKQVKADDVMALCQQEAAKKQIHMDKLQQYLTQCIARKSIDAGLVETRQ
ncbi:MAG: hypothetical protein LDL27_10890 [Desulfovibrio sp.]|nr:hypothetical protein [Desulfovibrio sp.]